MGQKTILLSGFGILKHKSKYVGDIFYLLHLGNLGSDKMINKGSVCRAQEIYLSD